MFNRTFVHKAGNSYTTVNQQPNDAADAARLFGELQGKAEDKIKSVVCSQLEGIKAEYAIIDVYKAPHEFKNHFFVAFKLNGKDVKIRIECDDLEKEEKAVEAICKEIVDQVFMQISPALYQVWHGRRYG